MTIKCGCSWPVDLCPLHRDSGTLYTFILMVVTLLRVSKLLVFSLDMREQWKSHIIFLINLNYKWMMHITSTHIPLQKLVKWPYLVAVMIQKWNPFPGLWLFTNTSTQWGKLMIFAIPEQNNIHFISSSAKFGKFFIVEKNTVSLSTTY